MRGIREDKYRLGFYDGPSPPFFFIPNTPPDFCISTILNRHSMIGPKAVHPGSGPDPVNPISDSIFNTGPGDPGSPTSHKSQNRTLKTKNQNPITLLLRHISPVQDEAHVELPWFLWPSSLCFRIAHS